MGEAIARRNGQGGGNRMSCDNCETHDCLTCEHEQDDPHVNLCKECVDTIKLGELPNWKSKEERAK